MAYFHTNDIVTLNATVTNMTRGGSMFATTPKDESIFINPQIVDALKLGVGDNIYAYSVDNFRDLASGRVGARWRAIRVEVVDRLVKAAVAPQPAPEAPVEAPVVVAAPAPAPEPEIPLHDRYAHLLEQKRAWTAVQIADELKIEKQRIHSALNLDAKSGRVASAVIYASRSQKMPSKIFYAGKVETLTELLDGFELDD